MRRPVSAFLILTMAASALATLTVGRAYAGGLRGTDVVNSQLRHLDEIVADVAPDMQLQFPEGEFFTWTMTGLAAVNLAEAGVDISANRALLDRAVAATGAQEMAQRFGQQEPLDHGAFYHGWRLLLLEQQAQLSEDPDLVAAAAAEAQRIVSAIDASPDGLVTSYPGRSWPCDNVVAMAAVHRVSALRPVPGLAETTDRWLEKLEQHRDESTGLWVHESGGDLPRGSSQSIIQTFLPDISAALAETQWQRYRSAFLVAAVGLIGFREYPIGQQGDGDVDSGPLLFGVSASASAVSLAAARVNGDLAVATNLDREAELLGLTLPAFPGRSFALGQLPIGDAFVAWARSVPVGSTTLSLSERPRPAWTLWIALALAPGIIAAVIWCRGQASRRT
ncbi:MAG: hypothetical protein ACK5KO_08460 [Arachnia sp.]